MKIFCNAGHSLNDPGTNKCGCGITEAALAMEVRNELKKIVGLEKDNFEWVWVPDEIATLRETIDWIKERMSPNDFAIDIHFNANNNTSIRGTEAYHHVTKIPYYAKVFSEEVSLVLRIPNRGPISDDKSFVGSLGFVRELEPSVIVECAYLTNKDDIASIDAHKTAQGIKNAVYRLFPRELIVDRNKDQIKYLQEEIKRLSLIVIELSKQVIAILLARKK